MFHRSTIVCLLITTSIAAQDWPAWRGPSGTGVAAAQKVPLKWTSKKNVKWKTPLAQPGNGSPIVSQDRVFLTMSEDAAGKGRSLYSFDRKNGRELWVRTVSFDRKMPTHGTNPYCSTTPAADGERVVVWHASAGLYCYDFAGEELWKRDLGEFRHEWGHGTSPILHAGRVILHSGPGEQSFVAAFDLETGKTIWRQDEPNHLTADQIKKKRLAGSWCTPLIHRNADRDLVLCAHPTRIVAYDAKDGAIVWSCAGVTAKRGDLTYSSPTVADDMCVIVGGYVGPTIGVRLGGKGDVTKTHRVWRRAEQMSNCASGVAVNGFVFIPDMGGFLHCIEAKSGETAWKKRIGRGQIWGSILLVDDRLYLMNQAGTTFVFEPNPKGLVVLAENPLGEKTNSTPAIAGGEIFLRTHESLYCVSGSE